MVLIGRLAAAFSCFWASAAAGSARPATATRQAGARARQIAASRGGIGMGALLGGGDTVPATWTRETAIRFPARTGCYGGVTVTDRTGVSARQGRESGGGRQGGHDSTQAR